MTDLVLDAFSTSNKMAGENFAMLASEENNLDKNSEKIIALFVQNLLDDLLILGYDFNDVYSTGLEIRLNALCSEFKTSQEKLVREICQNAIAETILAFLSKKINGDNLARKDNSYE